MAEEFYRFRMDLAVKKSTYDALTQVQKDVIKDRIRALKALANKINAGAANEEDTIQAKWHLCQHELGLPCPEDRDI